MKSSKIILRALQTLTGLTVIGIMVMALGFFDALPFSAEPKETLQTNTIKIKRPRVSKNRTFVEYIDSGDSAAFRGDLTTALQSYQKASEIEPREPSAYEKIGEAFLKQKNYESARQNFELAKNLLGGNDRLNLKIGRSLLGLRKVIEAKVLFEAVEPPTQRTLYYRGLIAAFLNEQESAKDLLTKSLSAGTDAELIQNAQNVLTVYRDFELARGANIEFLQAMLAHRFDQAGEYGLAIELSFQALKTKHDYRDVWLTLGHAFLNENRLLDAEDAFTKAIDLDAGHPTAYFFRGLARKQLQKPLDLRVEDFEKALELGWKPQIIVKGELAEAYFEMKNFEAAFPLYRDIVMTDPSNIENFIRPMALAINHLAKPQDALALANKAYETHPKSAETENLLGWALLANNQLEESQKHLQEAILLNPNLAAAFLNFGTLLEKQRNPTKALEYYGRARDLAEQQGNSSIGETAEIRYNNLNIGSQGYSQQTGQQKTPANTPQIQYIPSLSLE